MRLRLVILANDGSGARNFSIGPGVLALALIGSVGVVGAVLWIGWKIGEFTAQF